MSFHLKMAESKKLERTSKEHLRLAAIVKDTHRSLRQQVTPTFAIIAPGGRGS